MMRILLLCNKPPLPAVDGGCLAMHAVTEGLLNEGAELRVLAIATPAHPFIREAYPAAYLGRTGFQAIDVDTKVKALPALLNIFSSGSYNISRFYSAAFEKALTALLSKERFDIIQLESIYMGPYIPVLRKHSDAKIVVRAHNVEHLLWQRRTEGEKNALKKSWFRSLTRKLRNAENAILAQADAIVPITREDGEYIAGAVPGKAMHVLPYTMKLPQTGMGTTTEKNTVCHIGAMDWAPNIQGVKWLVQECWPLVLRKVPGAKLVLAGRKLQANEPAYSGPNIEVKGEAENALDFIARYPVMAVPLFSGGGMRVKLIEAMAMQKAIVTTPVGAEGTGIVNGRQALIADDAESFAAAIARLLSEPEYAAGLGQEARLFVSGEFEPSAATRKLIAFYQTILT